MDKDASTMCSADTLTSLGDSPFDAIVIGAGVGGAAAAIHLANRLGSGTRVLLVERSPWPRSKVCGCCLNNAAVALLDELQISSSVLRAHGTQIARVEARCGTRVAEWSIPSGMAISRDLLDSELVRKAMSDGVIFLDRTGARVIAVGPDGQEVSQSRDTHAYRVVLKRGTENLVCSARIILVADGLAGSALEALPEFQSAIQPGAWIGLGAVIEGELPVAPGTINLNIGEHGYVGLVRLSDGHLNLAAAIDPQFVKQVGGAELAARLILDGCATKIQTPNDQAWSIKGTAMLTRRRQCVARPGLLVIGDAASYVEPFTGEGMTWALASAKAAAALASETILEGSGHSDVEVALAWQGWHNTTIRKRQLASRLIRAITHRPALARVALTLLGGRPWRAAAAAAVARRLSAPYPCPPCRSASLSFGGAAA